MTYDIVGIISNLGFPIAITIYLLLTRDKIIQQNTAAINNLAQLIETQLYNGRPPIIPPIPPT